MLHHILTSEACHRLANVKWNIPFTQDTQPPQFSKDLLRLSLSWYFILMIFGFIPFEIHLTSPTWFVFSQIHFGSTFAEPEFLLEAVVQRCSVKKVPLEMWKKFMGKHLCLSLFFNKVAILSKKRPWHWCFLVKFVKFLRTLFT